MGTISRFFALSAFVVATAIAGHADTVSASALSPVSLTPSADSVSLDASSASFTGNGSFTQTGTFFVGDSGSLVGTYLTSLTDSITINGITQGVTLNVTDVVNQDVDYFTLVQAAPASFGDLSFSFDNYTSPSLPANSSSPITLTGTITPTAATPEPSSLLLVGSGIFGVAATVRRRLAL
jgi:hypothetical protein